MYENLITLLRILGGKNFGALQSGAVAMSKSKPANELATAQHILG